MTFFAPEAIFHKCPVLPHFTLCVAIINYNKLRTLQINSVRRESLTARAEYNLF